MPKQNRFKSRAVWAAVACLIILVMSNYGLFDKIGMTEDIAKTITTMILSILVGFGILNDPTNKDGF